MLRCAVSVLSRPGAALAVLLALAPSAQALAQEDSSSAAPTAAAQEQAPKGPADGFGLGAMLDVSAPEGIGISAVVRPVRWLRINAGVATNTLSLGVRGGVTLVPLSSFISPSISLDAGHYFNTNYNELVDRLGGIPLKTNSPIDDVGFNYGSASVGLELGKPERFLVSIHAGLTHGAMTIENAGKLLQDVTGDPDITSTPLMLRFTTPSLKVGFLLYFF